MIESKLDSNLIFQFQYGAIESSLIVTRGGIVSEFQFQYGAIESFRNSLKANAFKKFQFQYGAIESMPTIDHQDAIFAISIPVWCDWESFSAT